MENKFQEKWRRKAGRKINGAKMKEEMGTKTEGKKVEKLKKKGKKDNCEQHDQHEQKKAKKIKKKPWGKSKKLKGKMRAR